jgi:Tfp pilus assembly protein PilX
MNREKPKAQHPASSRDGFALIATLSLMVLLAILAVGLLGLSSVSLRSSSQGTAQQQARANARLALMLAVGELQAELGPDRRVNCQADIDDEAVAGQRKWLGVYDAWNATEKNRPDAQAKFRRYLVSGDREALRVRDAAKTAIAGDSIGLVGEGTLGAGVANAEVRASLVPLQKSGNNPSGHYAWWIGDDNAKAMVNAGRDVPAAVSDTLLAQNSAQSAPGTGYRLVSAFANLNQTGREQWEMGDDLRLKGSTLASLDLLPGVPDGVGANFHDITASSAGLLADVRNGRLKRDLSLYLERPYGSYLRQPLYTVNGTSELNATPDSGSAATLDSFSGITMEELWVYYNLYKEVSYSRPASSDDIVGRRPPAYPTLLSGNSRDAVVIDRFFPYKRKIFTQVSYMLSLAATPNTSQAGKFDLALAIDPVVVLWNPYNVALEYQTGGFYTVGFSGLPYTAEFQTPGGTVAVNFNQFFPHTAVNQILAPIGQNHAIVLQPGESRVFTRADGLANALRSGWRYTEGILISHASFPKALDRASNVRLTLKPNATQYLNYITYWFGPRTPTPAYQAGSLILRGDTAAGTMPTVTTPQTLTVGNIVDEKKIPHMLLSQHMRPETNATTPSKPWIWGNPSVILRQAADGGLVSRLTHQMEITVKQVDTWEDPSVQITPGNQAYWGGSTRADFGVPFFTLRGIPLTPMGSIASFQHSCANGFRRHWKDSTVFTPRPGVGFPASAESLDGHRYLAPMGSKLIGNSFAHPLIPSDKTNHQVTAPDDQTDPPVAVSLPVADHSYLANAALWDSWYLSSLAPQTVEPYGTNKRNLQQVFDDFFPTAMNTKPVPLPSVRMRPYRQGNEAALRALVSGGTPSADAYRKLAAHLMVDGAFNVNSTSVTAWKVMLGSLRGHDTARRDRAASSVTLETSSSGETPVNGMTVANGPLAEPSHDPQEPDQWAGFRSLSDEEIGKLATSLVDEIRTRGPFLCLSDFINRRPGSDAELARHGALQAAIEKSEINGNLDKGTRALGTIAGANFPDAGKGSRAAGIPGYITQADLLTPLGPVLQARSDSFTIRAYGSATDSGGKVLAQAWCEATVQRIPDYLDPADAPDAAYANLTSAANRTFGRQFRVTSFRWLNPSEV